MVVRDYYLNKTSTKIMSPILILTITIITMYLIKFYVKRQRFEKHLQHLPEAKGLPLLGNALDLTDTKSKLVK